MRYVKAKWDDHQKSLAYRIYISDTLFAMAQQKYLTKRYVDLISNEPQDDRSGDEIALDVIAKCGLNF